jgi:D-alanyl-lipoteichoic acid acyltransferase DltB (MBOAT superfamily)
MLFNSVDFIIFFPIATISYFLVPWKFRWLHLLFASCIFYAAFIPSYLLILFSLIVIDYTAGLLIQNTTNKKLWLAISILSNIGLLGVFKYYNFFISNINSLSNAHLSLLHLALPIGLSFHTFQSLSYTIEVYRGKQKAIKHFGYYSLYIMFYPQLVAGPIERPYNLFPQFFSNQKFSWQNLYEGLRLMAWGFLKKTVIADRLSEYTDSVFTNPHAMNAGNIWLGVFFFSIQIYADFSGYSDIAIGSARCMGYNLMIYFNRPYMASGIREFWQRWHISLSSWFRDYVYIPLGGNRKGVFRKNINLLITFILSGFWHGAAWTFIMWGLLHGTYVLISDTFSATFRKFKLPVIISYLLTGISVCFAWIFFRASSLQNAIEIITQGVQLNKNITLSSLTSIKTQSIMYGNFSLVFIFSSIIYMFFIEKLTDPLLLNISNKKWLDIALFSLSILGIIFYGVFHKTSFIYFQF